VGLKELSLTILRTLDIVIDMFHNILSFSFGLKNYYNIFELIDVLKSFLYYITFFILPLTCIGLDHYSRLFALHLISPNILL